MMLLFDEAKSTVATRMITGLVQVDVDTGVPLGAAASVAPHDALVHFLGRNSSNQFCSPLFVHLFRRMHEPCKSVVVIFPFLASVCDDIFALGIVSAENRCNASLRQGSC